LEDEKIEEFNFLLFSSFEKENKEVELLDKEELEKKLENYSLSVSDLNKYLRCPVSFYFENILRVPK
jgi:DNA helicase-2/ATP-dependent DNA helicase PcrA